MTVTLLIPTLNEIDGMRAIMPEVAAGWCDQIIILDGGSTDGTVEYAREHNYDVVIQEKPGLFNAYWQVYEYIRGDIVITFSPDGNSMTERLIPLIRKIEEGYDIVTVSRYLDWATSEDDDFITGLGNRIFTKFYNFLFRQRTTDYLVMYRAFRRNLVDELNIKHSAISWQSQLMCRAAKAGKRLGEIPGNEPKRIGGKRKMRPIKNGIAELRMLSTEFFR